MAAALLETQPDLLAATVLFRPLAPFTHEFANERDNHVPSTPVLIIEGTHDHRRDPGDGQRLAQRLHRAGAVVTHHLLPAGHAVTPQDRQLTHDWLHTLQT